MTVREYNDLLERVALSISNYGQGHPRPFFCGNGLHFPRHGAAHSKSLTTGSFAGSCLGMPP